jgi:hypothetical protein
MAGVVSSVDALFEEFVARWRRDEMISVDALLEQAGAESDELARLIDAFLARAPRREPLPEARAAVAALAARLEQEPPLLAARVASRARVRDVVAAIIEACALPAEAEQLVRSYYQRLEGGLLDPKGVSNRVWAVLEQVLGPAARRQALKGFSHKHVAFRESLAFRRLADVDPARPAAAVGVPSPREELPPDVRRRVDELFTAH